MNRPHPTVEDMHTAVRRFHAEAKPGEMHTGRYRMRYVEWGTGDGPPIVFVHGLCDEPLTYSLLMAELVDRGYRNIVYHLPNGKDDEVKLKRYKHDDYVDDLIALLDHLHLQQPDVLGTSFGSTITLRALARNPERFRRAVLQAGFARRPLAFYEGWPSLLARSWGVRMKYLPLRYALMSRIEGPQFVGCPRELYRMLFDCSGKTPVAATACRTLTLGKLDLRPQLPSIPHPLLMIGGDRDSVVYRWCEAEVEAGVPNVRRVEFAPCGHYPQYTMPAPYAEEVDNFLRAEVWPARSASGSEAFAERTDHTAANPS